MNLRQLIFYKLGIPNSDQVTETEQTSESSVIDERENSAGDFVISKKLAIETNAETHRSENEWKDTLTSVLEGQFSSVSVIIFVEY